MKNFTKEFFVSAIVRAVRTFAQTALGFLTIGLAFSDVDWLQLLSVAGVSAVYSILTSMVTGLPEIEKDGELLIDNSGDTTKWLLQVDTPIDDVEKQKSIRLEVKPGAQLQIKDEQ